MRHNNLHGGWYVEPYAGGAGAAIFLLLEGHVDHIVINDADPVVYAFWRAVTEHTDELIDRILTTPVSMSTWTEQRAVVDSPVNRGVVDLGFAAFFLNRTNRSGILEGGVVGGKQQAGSLKLDARYNQAELVERIKRIGTMASHITVYGIDALELLQDATPGFPERCLVYLDPPYYIKGSQLYRNHYKPADHAAIAGFVTRATFPAIVTYDDCSEIRNLYRRLDSATFSLHYSTHLARAKTSEALFYKNLQLPVMPQMTRGYHLTQQVRTNVPMLSQKPLRS
jgi:DNA adenine methylase